MSPYFEGYLFAHICKVTSMESDAARMPPATVSLTDRDAMDAYRQGMADSIADRWPRKPFHRVNRAHPPWRLI